MPIYEYRCNACEHETEALQKMSDKPLRKCPECGKMQLQRLISAPAFRLKGGGWYETDFKSDKDKKRNLAGDGDKAGADTSAADNSGAPKSGDSGGSSDKAATAASGTADSGKKADKKSDKKPGKKSSSSAVA